MRRILFIFLGLIVGLALNAHELIESKVLANGLFRITVDGINCVALIDSSGNTLLSDNLKEYHSEILLSELKKLGSTKISVMINTHYHDDHCGGNIAITEPMVISHINNRNELSIDHISTFWQDTSFAFPDYALPDITFTKEMVIFFGKEEIKLQYFSGGHTNSDIVVYFKEANVVHLGDLLFSIGFPSIDSERGGSAKLFAANLKTIMDEFPDDAIYVAGHGDEFTKQELINYQKMIYESVNSIEKEMDKGLDLNQIKEKKLLNKWVDYSYGYFDCNDWAEILYESILWNDSLNRFFDVSRAGGNYFDLQVPNNSPLTFSPGIISKTSYEGCSGFSNNMNEFIFQRWNGNTPILYITRKEGDEWTKPQMLEIQGDFKMYDFTLTPLKDAIVFASSYELDELGEYQKGHNIFILKKNKKEWNVKPESLGFQINSKYHDSYPSMALNGNIYFFSRRPGGYGDSDIYMSELKDGVYQQPVNLGTKINTKYHEWDPYIAPDESYLIFCSKKPESYGEDDLYVSFKLEDGTWSFPVNFGEKINSIFSENRPYVSPDGKYLFFTRNVNNNRNIYWVDAGIIMKIEENQNF